MGSFIRNKVIIVVIFLCFAILAAWLFAGMPKIRLESSLTLTDVVYQKEVAGVVFKYGKFVESGSYIYNGNKIKKINAVITIVNTNDFEVFIRGYGRYPSSSNDGRTTVVISHFSDIIAGNERTIDKKLPLGGFYKIYDTDVNMLGVVDFTEAQ